LLFAFQMHCLKNYRDSDLPFEVEENKAHVFFKDVVLNRTTTKTFHDMSCKTKKILVDRLKDPSQQLHFRQPASDQNWRNRRGATGGDRTTDSLPPQRVVDMDRRKIDDA